MGLEYASHHPRIIRSALAALPIRPELYTFINLGCGKGRVLLVASEWPFRRIVGVEFAPPLANVARKNLQRCRWLSQRCRELTVVTMDALDYKLPRGPKVLYLANPFFPKVTAQVMANIERSFQDAPHELFVLFVGLQFRRDESFGAHPGYDRLYRDRYFDVYQHRPAKAAQRPMAV